MRNPLRKIGSARNMLHEHGFFGWEAVRVLCDMLYCRKKFHCTYTEYFGYKFHDFKDRLRKNYLLRYHQRVRYLLVNTESGAIVGKERQYTVFHDKIKREWMQVTVDNIAEVESFIRKHGKVIFKPNHGSQGSGIFVLCADEMEAHWVKKHPEILKDGYICEQYVIQHPKMAEMNDSSVNTIRAITLCDGQNVKIISTGLRAGAGGGVCDNMSIGGVGMAIDMEMGVICTTGVDYDQKRYVYHPASGTKIPGFAIPYWNEVKEMICECALRVKSAVIVGWDIAVAEDGPCLIEANNAPAAKLVQLATNQPQGEDVINYINQNWRKYHKKIPKYIKECMKRWG